MSTIKYTQSNFTAGELDPKTYTRFDYDGYLKGCKTLRNFTPIPQGGFTNRFGQRFVKSLVSTNYKETQIDSLIYNDNAIYLLLWEQGGLTIFLQNQIVALVASIYEPEDIVNIYPTQLTNRLITTDGNHRPQILVRSKNASNAITGVNTADDTFFLTVNDLNDDTVYPVEFIAGTFPSTYPQIYANREYFVKLFTPGIIRVYPTAQDAEDGTNFFQVFNVGTGTALVLHNTWTLSNYPIDTYPTIDISTTDTTLGVPVDYSTVSFTLSSGTLGATGVTLTSGSSVFDATMVGGIYTHGGGVLRFDTFTSTTVMTGTVQQTFVELTTTGVYATVERPAWSDSLGWPRACSVYQNRVVFGGTYTFPNGVWLSATDDYANFDDTDATEDAGAISFYPSDGSMSYIRAITSAKTLILHTNTGNYSSAVSTDTPITPRNFTLTQQNRDGISDIIPVFTDNQVIYVDKSGNNVKNMVFDLVQGIFTLDNISLPSNHLINSPYDMDSFSQPSRTDGNFVLFLNENGTMANLLTLKAQEITGWSIYDTQQTYSTNYYRQIACAINQCWFLIERLVLSPVNTVDILDAFLDDNQWVSREHSMTLDVPTYVRITTSSMMDKTTPQLISGGYYWCVANDPTSFQLYLNKQDAIARQHIISINSEVTPLLGMQIIPCQFSKKLMIEEADFEINLDSAIVYTDINTNIITGLNHLEGETIQVMGDGALYADLQVRSGQVTLSSTVQNASAGLPFTCTMRPLEINTPLGAYGNSFYTPKQVKKIYIQYYQTVSGSINAGVINKPLVNEVIIGIPTPPTDGVCMYSLMQGWGSQDLIITQDKPLPMTILGLGYIMEDG